ncbi:hypothetical protein HNY73_009062 [Argiope bruennichi]|uniref:Uncharacterized protein n=1 Tax=Argiope bruennichi TaxID=94029 RepID=A0A8T0F8E0_ARGBR|nr:hypothetical protein HNY73_009062 [Argiope bruennichi]
MLSTAETITDLWSLDTLGITDPSVKKSQIELQEAARMLFLNTVHLVSITSTDIHTKRTVLSTIAKLFDPLGLLGPVISLAKIFLQKLWLLNLQWDDQLPPEIHSEWEKFSNELQCINNIKVSRCILPFSDVEAIELHGFSDASEAAFGAVVYCKSQTPAGVVIVKMVASKYRVAPLKKLTIPRLKLCAAVLLVKLMQRIQSALRLKVSNTYYWSDSMIVLSWIKKETSQLNTFVANRVATLQDLSCQEQWRHVSSGDNPADLISRGVNPSKMLESNLWWEGPAFLKNSEYPCREISDSVIKDDVDCELKKVDCESVLVTTLNNSCVTDILNCSNSYTKILHVISYVFRFLHNLRSPTERRLGPLTTEEIRKAETFIIKEIQSREF